MEDEYKCPKCGNTKRFYRDVSIPAKLRLDNTDGTEGKVYDIDTEPIYCAVCGEVVDSSIL